jgi:hypothetical protein
MLFTSATAIQNYLPSAGTPGVLTADQLNPTFNTSGLLGGEVTALALNIDFSAAGLLGAASTRFGDLRICGVPGLPGMTVSEFLALAENTLGGANTGYSAADIQVLADQLNGAFVEGVPSAFAQTNLVGGSGCAWTTGQMRTGTREGWDSGALANLISAQFVSMYGAAFTVGGDRSMMFTNPSALFSYLPGSGSIGALDANLTNPASTSSGVLGAEVVALKLNSDFSSLLGNAQPFGGLRICNFPAVPVVNGMTVDQFLAESNKVLGGGSAAFQIGTAAIVSSLLNAAFVDGVPSAFAQANLTTAAVCPS